MSWRPASFAVVLTVLSWGCGRARYGAIADAAAVSVDASLDAPGLDAPAPDLDAEPTDAAGDAGTGCLQWASGRAAPAVVSAAVGVARDGTEVVGSLIETPFAYLRRFTLEGAPITTDVVMTLGVMSVNGAIYTMDPVRRVTDGIPGPMLVGFSTRPGASSYSLADGHWGQPEIAWAGQPQGRFGYAGIEHDSMEADVVIGTSATTAHWAVIAPGAQQVEGLAILGGGRVAAVIRTDSPLSLGGGTIPGDGEAWLVVLSADFTSMQVVQTLPYPRGLDADGELLFVRTSADLTGYRLEAAGTLTRLWSHRLTSDFTTAPIVVADGRGGVSVVVPEPVGSTEIDVHIRRYAVTDGRELAARTVRTLVNTSISAIDVQPTSAGDIDVLITGFRLATYGGSVVLCGTTVVEGTPASSFIARLR